MLFQSSAGVWYTVFRSSLLLPGIARVVVEILPLQAAKWHAIQGTTLTRPSSKKAVGIWVDIACMVENRHSTGDLSSSTHPHVRGP